MGRRPHARRRERVSDRYVAVVLVVGPDLLRVVAGVDDPFTGGGGCWCGTGRNRGVAAVSL